MTNRSKSWSTLVAVLAIYAAPARAEAPDLVSYQGLLTLPSGAVVEGDSYVVRFEVFAQSGGGAAVYSREMTVGVRNGLFNVLLSDLAEHFNDDEQRFMQVTILSGEGVTSPIILSPRQQIASVPYALVAQTAHNLVDPSGDPPVPPGAIILWDLPTGCEDEPSSCPCGYTPVLDLAGRMARGADLLDASSDIPNEPGHVEGVPGGSGRFGDQITTAEMPQHAHPGSATAATSGAHKHGFQVYGADNPGSKVQRSNGGEFDDFETPSGGSHDHQVSVSPEGGSGSHYHPFYTVLFCRRM
jgi:hypothetical protein